MDPILSVLISWQFILFGLAVAGVMYILRILVEYFMQLANHDPTKSKLWSEVLLPILPVVIGAVWALKFRTFPYPDNLDTKGDRIIFGLVAGLLSTLMYRIISSLLSAKTASTSLPVINVIIGGERSSTVEIKEEK